MEVAEKKRVGNPNFKKKEEVEIDKVYEFELIKTYEKYKPTDENGNRVMNLYPPVYCLPNKGLAFDEDKKKQRAWRYIRTEESIWIDEQREISPEEESFLLSDLDNQLEFRKGKLKVRGIEKNKLEALKVQDTFEDKKIQIKQVPRIFRLLNPDKIVEDTLENLDEAFRAESKAREATTEEMFIAAFALGIDLNREERYIKKDFILAAKTNPSFFLKQFVNPKNRYAYIFSNALKDNTISASKESGKLLWGESGTVIMQVNSSGDVANELATKAMSGDQTALKLFDQLEKL